MTKHNTSHWRPKGGVKKEITISKGETLPATEKPNFSFKLVEPSKNKSGPVIKKGKVFM